MKSIAFYRNQPRMIHSSENHSFNNDVVKSYCDGIRKGLLNNLKLRLIDTILFQYDVQNIDKNVLDKIPAVISNYLEEKQKIDSASDQEMLEIKSNIFNDSELSDWNENPVSQKEAEKILCDLKQEEDSIQAAYENPGIMKSIVKKLSPVAFKNWVKGEAYELINNACKNVKLKSGMSESEINQTIEKQFNDEVNNYGVGWAGFFVRKSIGYMVHNATMFVEPKIGDNIPIHYQGYLQNFTREVTTKGSKKLATHLSAPSKGYKGEVDFQVLMKVCETSLKNSVDESIDRWFGSDKSKKWQQILDAIEEQKIIRSKKDTICLVEELNSLDLNFSSKIENLDKNYIKKVVKEEYEIIEREPDDGGEIDER